MGFANVYSLTDAENDECFKNPTCVAMSPKYCIFFFLERFNLVIIQVASVASLLLTLTYYWLITNT